MFYAEILLLLHGSLLNLLLVSFTAIATVVTVAEILKNNGFAVEKSKISCSKLVIVYYVFYEYKKKKTMCV